MQPRAPTQSGFTLIEILVVLCIVALVSGLAALTIGQRDSRIYAAELSRLKTLLQQTADRALINQEVLGIEFENQSYSFHRLTGTPATWQLLESGNWDEHQLPDDLRLTLAPGVESRINMDNSKQVLFFPDGQYTAFSVEIHNPERYRTISGDGLSAIELRP